MKKRYVVSLLLRKDMAKETKITNIALVIFSSSEEEALKIANREGKRRYPDHNITPGTIIIKLYDIIGVKVKCIIDNRHGKSHRRTK